MKNLIIALIIALCPMLVKAQAINRGTYGTQSNYAYTPMKTITPAAVVKNAGRDTLSNGDTGYVWVFAGQGYDLALDLFVTTITGTVASTSNILYGVNNNGAPLTPAQVATITTTAASTVAFAITGNTTYCAGCIGASSTTVPGASKHYIWQVPNGAGGLFDNYIIRTIQTGTCTATYTGKAVSQY